jgi:hypothetical protein
LLTEDKKLNQCPHSVHGCRKSIPRLHFLSAEPPPQNCINIQTWKLLYPNSIDHLTQTHDSNIIHRLQLPNNLVALKQSLNATKLNVMS